MLIEVHYQCWGCGSEKIELEEEEINGILYPSKTVWNLCPGCTRRANEKRRSCCNDTVGEVLGNRT